MVLRTTKGELLGRNIRESHRVKVLRSELSPKQGTIVRKPHHLLHAHTLANYLKFISNPALLSLDFKFRLRAVRCILH